MKITEFNNSHLIHAVTLEYDETSPTKVRRNWHIKKDRAPGVVYFICIDDEIVKVGGSTQHIKSLVGQYCMNLESKAEPMFTRFPIYLMMLWLLSRGHRVDYYYMNVLPYKIQVPDLLTDEMVEVVATDFHGFETGCIQHVVDINGSVPQWNIAEGDHQFDPQLRVLFDDRVLNGGFKYDEFLSQEWEFVKLSTTT